MAGTAQKERMDAAKAIKLMLAVAGAATLPGAWLGMRLAGIIDLYGADPLVGVMAAPLEVWGDIARYPFWIGTTSTCVIGALVGAVIPWCVVMGLLLMRKDNQRPGEEQGSARWANTSELVPFKEFDNPDPTYNAMILSENAGVAISRNEHSPAWDRNINVIVLGGSGSGKTRNYVKPNVMQMYGDYFITDPKGDLIGDVGWLLVENGYDVRCFNTFIPERSLIYNPLHYVRTDLEIISFAEMLISMTTSKKSTSSDPFWEKAEAMLYMALIAFMRDYLPERDYHIGTLLRFMSMAQASESDENAQSPLDCIFNELKTGYRLKRVTGPRKPAVRTNPAGEETVYSEEASVSYKRVPSPFKRRDGKMPYHNVHADGSRGWATSGDDFALENYTSFKKAAGKTLKSILITCDTRLAKFRAAEVRSIIIGEDQMHLERLGDPDSKSAIFAVFRDTDQRTLGFLHGIMVYQAINILCEKALVRYGGRLPRFVDFILDEYRSLNLPSDISAMISVIRSRNIGMSIILQGISQLKELYDEDTAISIRACCDATLFLGASQNDEETPKFISDACGQQTVYDENVTSQHGGSGGWSRAGSKIARPLITPDEVTRLPKTDCIVFMNGVGPYRDSKYPLEKHPRFKQMKGGFDLKSYLSERASQQERDEKAPPQRGGAQAA